MDVLLGTPPPPSRRPTSRRCRRTPHDVKPSAGARAPRGASREPDVRRLPPRDGPDRLRARKLRCRRLWRSKDSGVPIDASGTARRRHAARTGPAACARRCCAGRISSSGSSPQKLLTYGMGRVIESYDMPAVRAIQRDAEATASRFSAIVLGIVKSAPFQMRRADELPATTERGPTRRRFTDVTDDHRASGEADVHHEEAPLTPHGPAGDGRHGGAAVPRRDGRRANAARRKTAAHPKTRLAAIEMVHGAAGSTVDGAGEALLVAGQGRRRLRVHARRLKSLEPFRDYITIVSDTDLAQRRPRPAAGRGRRPQPLVGGVPDRRRIRS